MFRRSRQYLSKPKGYQLKGSDLLGNDYYEGVPTHRTGISQYIYYINTYKNKGDRTSRIVTLKGGDYIANYNTNDIPGLL